MNILVIKHGAMGDFIMASGAMKSIREHYSKDKITLLTEKKYLNLFKEIPYFDYYEIDNRGSVIISVIKIIKIIFRKKIDLVIDLQNSSRTEFYHFFTKIFTKAKISSSKKYSQFRYIIPPQGSEHVIIGLEKQLSKINIKNFYKPNLDWMKKNTKFENNKPFIVFIPGTSLKGDYKKLPEKKYAELSNYLLDKGYDIFLTGSNQDENTINLIKSMSPYSKNKIIESGLDNFLDMCTQAEMIIANDTGPSHIAALSNTPLFWIAIDNQITRSCMPIGENVYPILSSNIKSLNTNIIIKKIEEIFS